MLPTRIGVAIVGVLGSFFLPPPVLGADVDAVRLWRAPDHTRVVLDLSASASFTSLTLENPDRFVVDLDVAADRGWPGQISEAQIDVLPADALTISQESADGAVVIGNVDIAKPHTHT